ncbi:hypothetical protein [Egbenema bharatensis]|uniref:hypothetical protein n=1 Tax=Egbenema bharatensis TaxID=3463334 RepID=UPI003A891985
MRYLIAVLPDRTQAESAYAALEQAALPNTQIDILGHGYKSAEAYDLLDPNQPIPTGQIRFSWIVLFGFVAGFAFNALTGIELVPALGGFGNHILGGLLASIAGGWGAYVFGQGVPLTAGRSDLLPYRQQLESGKYLIVVRGTAELTQRADSVLQPFKAETSQGTVRNAI